MSRTQKEPSHRNLLGRNKYLFLFLLVYLVLSIVLFDPKLFIGGDNAVYIILAESIVSGRGYRNIHLPDGSPHTLYPFGFPLMLSFFLWVFGADLIVLKLVVLLTGLGSVIFMYKIIECVFEKRAAILMPFYISLPIIYIYSVRILTEVPFLFFSLGAVYFFIKAQGNEKFFYYISFILALYAFYVRLVGIALVAAMMLYLLVKKEYKYFGIFLLLFCIAFIPWQYRNSRIADAGGYVVSLLAKDPLQVELGRVSILGFLERIQTNFVYYFFIFVPKTFVPLVQSRALLSVVGAVFLVIIAIGFTLSVKKFLFFELFFVFGFIILLVWPKIWSSERFLLPILPMVILNFFFGLYWLANKINYKYVAELVVIVLVILNIVANALYASSVVRNNVEYIKGDSYAGYEYDWRRYFEMIDWIEKHIPEDKIIMARKPEFVYLLSRHTSFAYPITDDRDRVKEAIKGADYIILDNFYRSSPAERWLLPVLLLESKKYRLVHQTREPRFTLLAVIK